MNAKGDGNVEAAIEMLLDEIEGEIELVNSSGAAAFKAGEYDQVDQARRKVEKLRTFQEKVIALRKKWRDERVKSSMMLGAKSRKYARRNLGKLEPGTRTPEHAFRIPILAALVAVGGSGKVVDVLDHVGESMRGSLNEVDLAPLPSNPREIRWRNTAQWARNTMVQEGLMRNDSPRGIWEISEAGRRYLAEAQMSQKK